MTMRLPCALFMAVLALVALGSMALADPFDRHGYESCPRNQRLDSVTGADVITGVVVVHTDKADEITVSWDQLDPELLGLGGLRYSTVLTVIVEGPKNKKIAAKSTLLGATSVTLDDIDLATELDVSVAVTYRDYVISDIDSNEFTSGLAKPEFYASFHRIAQEDIVKPGETSDQVAYGVIDNTNPLTADARATATQGRFYFLGFGPTFTAMQGPSPVDTRFRVGLRHGSSDANPDNVNFDHFRFRIENNQGHDILGYDAQTIADEVYDTRVFTVTSTTCELDETTNECLQVDDPNSDDPLDMIDKIILASDPVFDSYSFSNIHEANTLSSKLPYTPVPNLADDPNMALEQNTPNQPMRSEAASILATKQFALGPDGYRELPSDVFDVDGAYTITAWAVDEDDHRISPTNSITFNIFNVANVSPAELDFTILSGPERVPEDASPPIEAGNVVEYEPVLEVDEPCTLTAHLGMVLYEAHLPEGEDVTGLVVENVSVTQSPGAAGTTDVTLTWTPATDATRVTGYTLKYRVRHAAETIYSPDPLTGGRGVASVTISVPEVVGTAEQYVWVIWSNGGDLPGGTRTQVSSCVEPEV